MLLGLNILKDTREKVSWVGNEMELEKNRCMVNVLKYIAQNSYFFKFKPYLSHIFSVIHKHILCLVTFLCGLETEVPF